jgi:hypothetical protein
MTDPSRTWRVTINRREVFEIFVEASSADGAEEAALEVWEEKQYDDPEPYERVIESVQAEETGY